MNHQETLTVGTPGRGATDLTSRVAQIVKHSSVEVGVCTVFIRHTSASLIIQENADPDVLRDLETFISRLVQDGDASFRHDAEGPDDMAAHIRSVITATTLSIPITGGQLALGTWQAIYLWEHRHRPHRRDVVVHVSGDGPV